MLTLPKNLSSFSLPFSFFRDIASIPHGSFHCDKIADYLVDFAKARGLSYERDAHHNVLIRKAASPGYENHPTVILQGHTDMVAVKDADCPKDMKKEGLNLQIDGDDLFAAGTSLGGDDGAFVAYALAVLDDDSLSHPPIEALFTSDEEVGLLGASALNPEWLKGRILLNMDSEDEGIFTFGCAGGIRCDCTLLGEKSPCQGTAYTVTLSGLVGGHSGVEIDKGRANAIAALAKMADKLPAFRLSDFHGGSADNVIPSYAELTFFADENPEALLKKEFKTLKAAYAAAEKNMQISVSAADAVLDAWDLETSKRMMNFVAETPFGPYAMSRDIEGLVETSQNPGVISSADGALSLTVSVRSSLTSQKRKLQNILEERTKAVGGRFETRGDYPAWEFKKDSEIRDVACAVFDKLYGKKPICNVIHAGLECGIFADKIPGLDAISFGPDMKDIHSPRERLSLSSSARVYEFLLALLKSL